MVNFNVKDIARKLRRVYKTLLGYDFFIKADVEREYVALGSSYGEWNIIPEYISRDSVVYLFGVGEDISFDLQLIEKYGATIHAFDPTPKSIKWVKSQNTPNEFIMHEYGILDYDGFVSFYPPKNISHVSHTIIGGSTEEQECIKVPVKKMQTILDDLQHTTIDLLKMDIEGSEYSVIKDLSQGNIRPKQLLVEFHHRFKGVGANKTIEAIKTIKGMGYELFFVSKSGEEYSFVLKDYI